MTEPRNPTEKLKNDKQKVEKILGDWEGGIADPRKPMNFRINDGEFQAAMPGMALKNGEDAIRTEEITERDINKYALEETSSRSFDSTLASSQKKKPGLAIIIEEDGNLRRLDKSDRTRIRSTYGERTPDWDYKMLNGSINVKATGRSGRRDGRGHNQADNRFKIKRQVLDEADTVYLIKFEHSVGGSRGNPETSSFKLKSAERLQEAADDGDS